MKNKQHEHILKAFLASKIPAAVYEHAPELVAVDSVIGGYCTRLLRRNKALKCSPEGLITKEERAAFAELINRAPDTEKDEIVIYYRWRKRSCSGTARIRKRRYKLSWL